MAGRQHLSTIAFVEEPAGRPGEVERVSPRVRRIVANNAGPYTSVAHLLYLHERGWSSPTTGWHWHG